MNAITLAKDILKEKHYAYAEKEKKEPDDEEFVTWLKPHVDAAVDLEDDLFLMIDELEETQLLKDNTLTQQNQHNSLHGYRYSIWSVRVH